jgi:haloalkane dehalogenase
MALNPPGWLDRQGYPFSSRYISLPAGRLHYVDEGRGDVVLFVHGTPTWSYEYRHVIAALSKKYRCVALDHLGFGLSERPPRFPYTPEAHAKVLAEFAQQLGLDRITLVVHDFGGPIGLPLVLQGSRVARVVILNSWAWPLEDDPQMARGARFIGGAAGRLLYKYANTSLRLIMPSAYGDRRKLTKAIHRQYLDVFRDREARVLVLHALARSLLGSRDFYQGLLNGLPALQRLPVLIIWGMKDSAFKPYQLARWQQLLPDAAVVTLADAGHWPHEEDPQRVIEAIERFLN